MINKYLIIVIGGITLGI